ncbi:MAG TPA: hypothetical protein VNV62_24170 [Trebonia sp.]|nr:hypothetical protein [Trebonia sp.]
MGLRRGADTFPRRQVSHKRHLVPVAALAAGALDGKDARAAAGERVLEQTLHLRQLDPARIDQQPRLVSYRWAHACDLGDPIHAHISRSSRHQEPLHSAQQCLDVGTRHAGAVGRQRAEHQFLIHPHQRQQQQRLSDLGRRGHPQPGAPECMEHVGEVSRRDF